MEDKKPSIWNTDLDHLIKSKYYDKRLSIWDTDYKWDSLDYVLRIAMVSAGICAVLSFYAGAVKCCREAMDVRTLAQQTSPNPNSRSQQQRHPGAMLYHR